MELLTGRRPYGEGDELEAIRAAKAPRRPTPRLLGASVSRGVERVFARALHLEPARRHPDAGAFWGALRTAATRRGWLSVVTGG